MWIAAAIVFCTVLYLVDKNRQWSAFLKLAEVAAVITSAALGYLWYDTYKMSVAFGVGALVCLWLIHCFFALPEMITAGTAAARKSWSESAPNPPSAASPHTAPRAEKPS